MTEDEDILIWKLGNEYYDNFSKLIANSLKKCPKHLQDEFKMIMQDKSSVYGSNYDKYLDYEG